MTPAFSGENSFLAREDRYSRDSRSATGTRSTFGSVTNQLASANEMRSASMMACRYGAVLKSSGVNVGIFPSRSNSSMMPSAINATIPWPLGGCSQTSSPRSGFVACCAGSAIWFHSFCETFCPRNFSEIASTGSLPTSR
ncbi:hypothetical protein RRF57_010401 [Xylaria bambusicola]|uniref:Uncharacterized protein n=1 Tax=Xylaria bambusicola TaxID=326684 RepID=A0AAN7ZCZ2_9PEZI